MAPLFRSSASAFLAVFTFCFLGINSHAQDLRLNEVMTSNSFILSPVSQESYDWVEVYNSTTEELNLSNYFLTDDVTEADKWQFPEGSLIAPEAYMLIWLAGDDAVNNTPDELQANFKLSSEGESIFMYSSSLELLDSSPAWQLQANSSMGRVSGSDEWFYLNVSSPEQENLEANAFSSVAQHPELTAEGGIFSSSFLWDYTPDLTEDVIYYTLDGSDPNFGSPVLQNAFLINESVVIKLMATREDALPSSILTHTYILDSELDLDIISLTTDPENLFGDTGIYDNIASDQEKEAGLEYFVDGVSVINQNVGVKIHAPDGRDQKSLRLYARSEYGYNSINYQLFPDKPIDEFKRLVLRNAGNDGAEIGESNFRDVLSHDLYFESNSENGISAFKAVNVFINAEYWGIYNLRERQDEYYLKSNYGYDPEQVDYLEYDYQEPNFQKTHSGNWNNWADLREFMITQDLSENDTYVLAKDWVDVDNFIDYQAFQIIIGNQDWCNNNTKFWRPTASGKWKWIMWDTEYGLGLFDGFPVGDPSFNFLGMAISWCGWGNDDYSWLFRNLLENEEFKTKYITRTQDLLNTSFLPSHVHAQAQAHKDLLELDIDKQFETWGSNTENWEESIGYMLAFTEDRPSFHLENMANQFDFEDDRSLVTVDISDAQAGEIKLNTLVLNDQTIGANESTFPWTGIYYDVQLMSLEALAYPGYEFSHWEGDIESEEPVLEFILNQELSLTAVYNINSNPSNFDGLVINELLSQNSSIFPDNQGEYEDWMELYNGSSGILDISTLFLSDDANDLLKFQITSGSDDFILQPGEHIIFFADNDEEQGENHTNFGLNAQGETLFLSFINDSDEVEIIDQIEFGPLALNESYGRETDAAEDWILFETPTPNAENQVVIIDHISELANSDLAISLYPNPAKNSIQLISSEFDLAQIATVLIYSMDGKLVKQFNTFHQFQMLDVSDLFNGMYLLQIINESNQVLTTKRFVKQ